MPADTRSTNYVFTLNNYTSEEVTAFQNFVFNGCCRFVAFGKEVAESGTPHLQGVIVFKTKKSLAQVKVLNTRAHFERCMGTLEEALRYVKKGCQSKDEWTSLKAAGPNYGKDVDYHQYGVPPLTSKEKGVVGGQMEKDRYSEAREFAKKGNLDSIPADLYVRFYNSWKSIAKDHMEKPADKDGVTGIWIHGLSNTGKSRIARKLFGYSLYDKMCNKWWDGYQGEANILIDDLDDKHDGLGHYLKRWADRYSFLCETKGGMRAIRPDNIIVTSQYTPDDIWSDVRTAHAIKRRFRIVEIELSLEQRARYDSIFNPSPLFNSANLSVSDAEDFLDDELFELVCKQVRDKLGLPENFGEVVEVPNSLPDDFSMLTEPEPLDGETINSQDSFSDNDEYSVLSNLFADEELEADPVLGSVHSSSTTSGTVASAFSNVVDSVSLNRNYSGVKRRRLDLDSDSD